MSLQVVINRNKKSYFNTGFSLQRATKCHHISHHTSDLALSGIFLKHLTYRHLPFFFLSVCCNRQAIKSEEPVKVTILSAYFRPCLNFIVRLLLRHLSIFIFLVPFTFLSNFFQIRIKYNQLCKYINRYYSSDKTTSK